MKKYASLLLLLFLAQACGRKESAPASLTSALDQHMKETVQRLDIPGLTVAVTRNDSLIYVNAFGVTNKESGQPLTPRNIFHWASVSKTFVATSIMQLVEQVKINLDEKLVTYLPWFKQKDPNYKEITIRQMLNHTSGIGDVDDYEWDKPQFDEGALERFARSIANDPMEFAPGKGWRYSNNAFEVLGVVIEKVSGMSFEQYIRTNIFDPLEMKQSSFLYPEIPDSLRVSGHIWKAMVVPSPVYPYNRMHGPSSTLNSNVVEMTHYAMAHLHHGTYGGRQILQPASYDIMWTNSVNQKDEPQVGVSFFIDTHDGLKTLSHGGGDTGFRSYLVLVPEKNISVVMVSNYDGTPPDKIAYAVLDVVLGKPWPEIKPAMAMVYANTIRRDGLASADAFLAQALMDSSRSNPYIWNEEWRYRGYQLVNQGPDEEPIGIAVFRKCAELFPTSGPYGDLGNAYARLNQMDSARKWLEKSLAMDSTNSFAKRILKSVNDGSYPMKAKK